MKPLLVLVSGAPGSGKTTFARQLAEQMRILHIERDRAFDAMLYTLGPDFSREKQGIPRFYALLAETLKLDVSLVVDATLYRGKSEVDILLLHELATLVNVHCRASNEHQRFYEREVARTGGVPDWLPAHMPKLDQIYECVRDPLDLGCPCIEVNTTDNYRPSIAEVIAKLSIVVAARQ